MNRLKLWLYMLVVLGTGVAGVYLLTVELAQRSLQEVDANLQFGVSALRAQEQIVAGRVGALASLAVRDESLLEALAATAPAPAAADPKRKPKAPPADPNARPTFQGVGGPPFVTPGPPPTKSQPGGPWGKKGG